MVGEPRHPDKDLERIIREAEEHGWRRTKRPKSYFRLYCPCGRHIKTVALTPSGANYGRNLLAWFRRQDCWDQEEEQ